MTDAVVKRALESRRAQGAFRSVADFSRRAKLTVDQDTTLQAMAAAALAGGTYFRQ